MRWIKKLNTIPNIITLSRIVFGIAAFVFILLRQFWIALILYCIAALTDGLDGFLARKLKKTTELGSILDAITDRIFVLLVVLGLLIVGKLTPTMKILLLCWIAAEFIMGALITKQIRQIYLSITHRNSIRIAAVFLYIMLAGIIIDFKYINILMWGTLGVSIIAFVDHVYIFLKRMIKKQA